MTPQTLQLLAPVRKMLHDTRRKDSSIDQDATPLDPRLPIVSLPDVIAFVRRRLSLILTTCLVMWGLALLYLATATPTFTAKAALVVDPKTSQEGAASVSTIVDSQVEIIRSEGIARAVIGKLGLVEDPEFAGRDGIIRRTLSSIPRLLGWNRSEPKSRAERSALDSFERKLSVKRVGLTYVIGLEFDSIDPVRAAQILNAVAEAYIGGQLEAKYTSALRNEKWVKGRISELSKQASAAQNALATFKNSNDAADALDKSPPSGAQLQGRLRELEDAADSAAKTYDNFLRMLRYMEAQQQSAPALEAHLLTEASPPLRASSPKALMTVAISTLAGILLGMAIGLVRESSARGIRTNRQMWTELQLTSIGVVPMLRSDGVWTGLGTIFSAAAKKRSAPVSVVMRSTGGDSELKPALPNAAPADSPRRDIVRAETPIWAVIDEPQSRFAKAFLDIELSIHTMNRSGKRAQVIGITSTLPNEGKSTIAAALALHMTHAGDRVILADCNLQNRALSHELAPTAASGILDIMPGPISVSETIWTDSASGLVFLPVGNNSRSICATDLLKSDGAGKVFQTLRETYDYIIVDLPALTSSTGVRSAAHLLDSVILVVEWGSTDAAVVGRALEACSEIDETMLGVILNKADMNLPELRST